ncbi:hypothetical protein C8Q72DRAFT_289613 [Fomitopsis betulina]|nr:hypothetical protein C8Q72DRAFT_289613 [Fomitopsis betulina]
MPAKLRFSHSHSPSPSRTHGHRLRPRSGSVELYRLAISMRLAFTAVVILLSLHICSANISKRDNIPVCATTCISNTDPPDCPGEATSCRCSNADFIDNVKSCFTTFCSRNDLDDALNYLTSMCGTTSEIDGSPLSSAASSATLTSSPTLTSTSTSVAMHSSSESSVTHSDKDHSIMSVSITPLPPVTSASESMPASSTISSLVLSSFTSIPTATDASSNDGPTVHSSDPSVTSSPPPIAPSSSVPDSDNQPSPVSTTIPSQGASEGSTSIAYPPPAEPIYPSSIIGSAVAHSADNPLSLIFACAAILLCL